MRNQTSASAYEGGDNIFVTLRSRASAKEAPQVLPFTSEPLPAYHLPGLHWYHPHKHGCALCVQRVCACALETATAGAQQARVHCLPPPPPPPLS